MAMLLHPLATQPFYFEEESRPTAVLFFLAGERRQSHEGIKPLLLRFPPPSFISFALPPNQKAASKGEGSAMARFLPPAIESASIVRRGGCRCF